MTVRADVDKKFIRRFLFIAIGCFGLMAWALYDATLVYPIEVERAVAYKKLSDQVKNEEITEAEKDENWKAIVSENDWALAKPKSPEIAEQDIYFQWLLFGVGLLLGAFFLIKYLRLLNSWMQADDKKLTTSWGETLQFASITAIDKRKWEKKGIAKVSFTDEAGRDKTMIFDDFKYHRESMAEIMKRAEANLKPEKIEG